MGILQLVIVLALPLILGGIVAALLLRQPLSRPDLLLSGYGLLLGLLSATLILRLLDALTLELTPASFTITAGSLTVAALAIHRRFLPRYTPPISAIPYRDRYSLTERLISLFLAGLVLFHLGLIGYEVLTRPLYPFDATMHWATKARVWFEHSRLVPFVENQTWLELGGKNVFTDHHPAYPPSVPLLQVWIATALGSWDETLINLPWLFLAVALPAIFFGQARAAGVGLVTAAVFTYLLLSLPLLNTHLALAGYADLFLGTTYAAALMALHRWQQTRQPAQIALALILAVLGTQIKNEGFFWAVTLLPAILLVLLPARWIIGAAIGGLAALLLVLVLMPSDLVVAGHSLEDLRIGYRPQALSGLVDTWFKLESWHLMGYLLVLIPIGMMATGKRVEGYSALAVAIGIAVILYLILFLFTKFSGGAIRQTAAGRIGLHLTPGLMFLVMLVWYTYLGARDRQSSDSVTPRTASVLED